MKKSIITIIKAITIFHYNRVNSQFWDCRIGATREWKPQQIDSKKLNLK